ncbi:MAG: hypothetical protein ACKN86_01390, partial [Crocinitomicaceae bacterium]
MKKNILFIIVLISVNQIFSQKNVFLEIAPMFQNANLEMNTNYTSWDGKTIKFDHFDYYLSDVQ